MGKCKECGIAPIHVYKSRLCKTCYRRWRREVVPGQAAKDSEASRKSYYKKHYGIDLEVYDRLLAEQNGCCAICGKHESENTRGRLSVDHDHTYNYIRGLLCHDCNRGLGLLGDSYEAIKKVLNYLEI